jgi:hypothetical protein
MTSKLQIPNPKTQELSALPFWDFEFSWCLKFDVWSFSGAWNLELGVS